MTCCVHSRGRVPGQGVIYQPDCPECVRRRGHLPESERDVPGPMGKDYARQVEAASVQERRHQKPVRR